MSKGPEFIYLTLNSLLRMHKEMMEDFGGEQAVRNLDVIESAIDSPKGGFGDMEFYPDLYSKAACYAFQLSQGQGFVDGNKRIGALAALVFIELNGYEISEDLDMKLYEALIAVGEKKMSREELSDLLRELVCETLVASVKNP